MDLKIQMTEEEIKKDAHCALKTHNFSEIEDVSAFISEVNEIIGKGKNQM